MAALSKAKLLVLLSPAVPVVGKDRNDVSPGKVSLPSVGEDRAASTVFDWESALSDLEAQSTLLSTPTAPAPPMGGLELAMPGMHKNAVSVQITVGMHCDAVQGGDHGMVVVVLSRT